MTRARLVYDNRTIFADSGKDYAFRQKAKPGQEREADVRGVSIETS